MTLERRRGRPRAMSPARPVTIRLPDEIYDLYCVESILTMEHIATIFRRILVRHARVNFRNPKNRPGHAPAHTVARGVLRN